MSLHNCLPLKSGVLFYTVEYMLLRKVLWVSPASQMGQGAQVVGAPWFTGGQVGSRGGAVGRVPPGSGSWGEFVSHSPHPLFHSRVPGGRGRVSRLPPASSAPGCGSKDCLLPFTPPHSSQREKLLSVDRFPKIPLFWVWAALEKPAPPRGSESGSRGDLLSVR